MDIITTNGAPIFYVVKLGPRMTKKKQKPIAGKNNKIVEQV